MFMIMKSILDEYTGEKKQRAYIFFADANEGSIFFYEMILIKDFIKCFYRIGLEQRMCL